AFPVPDGMPVPRRVRILGMLAAVHEDLAIAVDVPFEQEEDVRGRRDDSPRIRGDARDAGGQTVRLGIVLSLTVLHDLLRLGQQWNRFSLRQSVGEIADWTASAPHA